MGWIDRRKCAFLGTADRVVALGDEHGRRRAARAEPVSAAARHLVALDGALGAVVARSAQVLLRVAAALPTVRGAGGVREPRCVPEHPCVAPKIKHSNSNSRKNNNSSNNNNISISKSNDDDSV